MGTEKQCKICLETIEANENSISPCACTGTISHVHNRCFHYWIIQLRINQRPLNCEICNQIYSFEPSDLPIEEDYSFWRFLVECFSFNQANRKIIYFLLATILVYIFAYFFLCGPLLIKVHHGELPDMDMLFWDGTDSYVEICVDLDCRCRTGIVMNENRPKWNYNCKYWNDQSVFLFSKINFSIMDSDYYKEELIGQVTVNILWHQLNLFAGNSAILHWGTPYNGSIYVTIQWTTNFKVLIINNTFYYK